MSDPKSISRLEDFEIKEDYACFRPEGQVSLEEAIRLVRTAIAFAREHQVHRLLINVSNLTGFEPPSVVDRYWFVRDWANEAKGAVKISLVARPEMIDPQKFGVTVARNYGLSADVFSSEPEALEWLLSARAE